MNDLDLPLLTFASVASVLYFAVGLPLVAIGSLVAVYAVALTLSLRTLEGGK